MSDKIPSSSLRLEWVYGYRGHQCKNNLWFNISNELVYFVAGVGIVYNMQEKKQRFFFGHSDDIICLALHPENLLVCTGQVGKAPFICIWNSKNMDTVSLLKGGHENGIAAVSFSKDGLRIASVGLDVNSIINLWDWKKGKILATVRGHNDRIFDIQFTIDSSNIASCGVKHIKFWSFTGNTLTAKKGVFGKLGEIQTIFCMAYSQKTNLMFSGTMSGDIYVWQENNLSKIVKAAHKGSIFGIFIFEENVITGGIDSMINVYSENLELLNSFDLTKCPNGYLGLSIRSICQSGAYILIGTDASEIYIISKNDKEIKCVMQGHKEGELWGLSTHTKKPYFVTASDDKTLRTWNYQTFSMQSKIQLDECARSCSFNPDGSLIAVGLLKGTFVVYQTTNFTQVFKAKNRKEVIHEIKFSPDGHYLAVGSNDNFIDIYNAADGFKKAAICSGNSSFITHIDWSKDSTYIQTNSGAAERLIFRIPSGKQEANSNEVSKIKWASFTGVLGNEVNGIWEKYTDTNDVNATDVNFQDGVIVTGDDFGLVKLLKFPSNRKGASFKKYTGHSAHVTNVKFTCDNAYVISTGGADHAIFQWTFLNEGPRRHSLDHKDIESCGEASDTDLSDVEALDSDIEKERERNYDRGPSKTEINSINKLKNGNQKQLPSPTDALKLQHVFGYRAFDTHQNLFYLKNGEVVYHTAAIGVVYNKVTKTQKFYFGHTDDILCLAVNPVKDFIATGQIGKSPEIHIWDAETLKSVSILKGHHERGVCACDFSSDGRNLASVGLDNDHSIIIWDWKKGEKLSDARGHKDKIYMIRWNPYEVSKLVTVGEKHIKFWNQAGGGLTSNRGIFGNTAKQDSMMCIVYGKSSETCCSGGSSGNIYVWNGANLVKSVTAHKGPCFAIHFLDKGYVTGGKDGQISLWDDQLDRCLKSFPIECKMLDKSQKQVLTIDRPAIRSVYLGHGHILAGTINSEVIELTKEGVISILIQGHGEGELWGLATHPNKQICCTVGNDAYLRTWEIGSEMRMNVVIKLPCPAQCCDFSPDGKFVAVGLSNGGFVVYNLDLMEIVGKAQKRKEAISDIKFSPGHGKYLAVASHDNFVDIYSVTSYQHVGVCKGASSYITHIDWHANAKLIAVNTGANELLFFEAPRGARQTLSAPDLEKMQWFSWTGVLGSTVEGIWPPSSDITDINATSLSANRKLLATADDFGFVKIFNYPVKGKNANYRKYLGHSAHVTNVRWSANDSALLSIGGADASIFVWKPVSNAPKNLILGELNDTDSDTEGDGGYDSDVDHELKIDYKSKFNLDPKRDRPKIETKDDPENITSCSRNINKISSSDIIKSGSIHGLKLESVIGYRGLDGRDNLRFINDGSEAIYTAAALGIIINLQSGLQRFYSEHSDDIICLSVNQKLKTVIATGQIGEYPSIHVWSATDMSTLSILRGHLNTGVCFINFSCSGRLMVACGFDIQHSIVIYNWQEGTKISICAGSQNRIFNIQFRPDSDSHLVSVGVSHLRFWHLAGNTISSKKPTIIALSELNGNLILPTFLSLAFGTNHMTYSGSIAGDIYIWSETTLNRVILKAHSGPIFSMFTTLFDGLIVTGAKEKNSGEGEVKLWDGDMKQHRSFKLEQNVKSNVVKSVARIKGRIIVGTKSNELFIIEEKSADVKKFMSGHGEGELWGLATHPTNNQIFATSSDDGTIKLWDLSLKKLIISANISASRCIDICKIGDKLAVGLNNGGFIILSTDTLKTLGQKRERGSIVNVLRFSLDGSFIVVGYEDGFLDFFNVSKPSNIQRYTSIHLSSYILSIDISEDNKYVRIATGSNNNHVIDASSSTEIKDINIIAKILFSTWTSICGNEMKGTISNDMKIGHINAATVNKAMNNVIIGDDYGLIKLYNFPCNRTQENILTYMGHSAHVTNVRFTNDDKYLVSTGGDDNCIFIWKCI